MQQSKRIINRQRKKLIFRFFSISALFIIVSGVGIYLFVTQRNKPLYISPLASNFHISAPTKKDHDISEIKKGLSKLSVKIDKIGQSGDDYVVTLKDKTTVIFSGNKNIETQLSSLQFILTRLTMEGKSAVLLDLRFDKPVIRLK